MFECDGSCSAGKLLSRTHKIAYNLLHKVGSKGNPGVKAGDRVSWAHDMVMSHTVSEMNILTCHAPTPTPTITYTSEHHLTSAMPQ